MKCNICKSEISFLFKSMVLNKYDVDYFKCPNCDFIQTEKPFWLNEAYNNAITDLDVGLVSRNLAYSVMLEKIIKNNFNSKGKFLDYAGGYGLFVRLMRDKGFNFYREDRFCENIFSKNYDLEDVKDKNNFEVVTAFEVFEHLENPIEDIERMLQYSDTVIFSTELQPNQEIKESKDWWYFTPETGQHISFYSEKTLKYIAERFHFFFFSIGNLHMMSKSSFPDNPLLSESINEDTVEIKSLIQSDFEFSKNLILKSEVIKKESSNKGDDIWKEELIHKLSIAFAELDTTRTELDTTRTELDTTRTELDTTRTELDTTRTELDTVFSRLNSVYASREWKALLILRKIIKIIIPKNNIRRNLAVSMWRLIKFQTKFLLRIIRKTRSSIFLCFNYFSKFKPKKRRKINTNSKKIVYIDHSYHNKTKSTAFLIDYLREFYVVEVILDESWNGGQYPDLSFIDESYLGVIFFQLLPSEDILNSIKNSNIVYFPMYDQSGRLGFDFWHKYKNIKIINFSKTLHGKLNKWGLESMSVQYFPKPQECIPGKKDEVFLWQRLTQMNIDVISKLFRSANMKMHIHKAIDPNQQFQQPDKEQEKKFRITYSDWFDTREQMWDVIKQKGIYIAPREYEGIGMSFLEAMAMGKAVVAVNNPTMNEYIEHGKTGYLFDLNNPREIDFSNVREVQENTYRYMQEGYKKWEKNKHKIIEFIEKV